jgi:hypothetical protein
MTAATSARCTRPESARPSSRPFTGARFIGAPRSSGGRRRRAPAAPRVPRASPPR